MRLVKNFESLEKLISRQRLSNEQIKEKVSRIIKAVKLKGDEALVEFARKWDKVKLNPLEFRVKESEISAAFGSLNSSLISAFKSAIENVTCFYKQQKPRSLRIKNSSGKILTTKYVPLKRVGIYIPSGTAPLVSTVYMAAIPAIVAGVEEIVITTPARAGKEVNPFILALASLLKIKEIYRLGGAQAIAALAYGTKTIRKVDKIIGPGNEFVTEAKRQVFGVVDIDMLAGPSEIVIVASSCANSDYITADLEAQTEHHRGIGVVITNSSKLIHKLQEKKTAGFILKVKNLDDAASVVNKIAPEHLEIFTKKPSTLLKKIYNAGAIFLGENSPAVLGDYTAGPSHILPTGASARFFSALSLREFLKETHIISYTKKSLQEEASILEQIASLEGMAKHINSLKVRLT